MAGNMTIAYASLADLSSEKDKVKNFALIPLVIGAGFALGPTLAGMVAEISPAFPFIIAAFFSLLNLGLVAWKFPQVYPRNLKNREFDKQAPQNSRLERATIVRAQGVSEGENFEEKLTLSKTDFSSSLGIEPEQVVRTKKRFYAGIANISKAFYQNTLRPYFWVLFFMIASNLVFCQFIGPFAIEKFHINVMQVSYLYANIGISVALGHLFLTPRLSNHFSTQASLATSLLALAAFLVIVVFSWNLVILHLATIFVMLACAVAYTNAMALVSNQGGKEEQGEIMGIAVSVQSCAEFLPATIVGAIAALSQNISILMAALFAICSYLILFPLMKHLKTSP
jgi:predicted MFS family arabinose efflux permease